MDRVDFSVVIPVHNSEQSLTELTQKLDSVFIKLGKSYEIIFVNDGSTDNSLITLKTLHAQNNSIKIIDLFRNYGQQNAIMCGFNHCVGNIVLTMDDDLQHDPNDIPKLFDKLQEGFDVVIGVFSTKKHSIIKNMGSACIRALNKRIFKLKDKNLRFTSYRMMRKEVIDQIKDETTNYP
jgi:glycosyltransferase involved in cell wall biosynthesis